MEPVEGRSWRECVSTRYEELMNSVVEMSRKGLGGSVYTEATDVFWERGGFVTFVGPSAGLRAGER